MITIERKKLEQVLEALDHFDDVELTEKAIAVVKAALAQPAQEPVCPACKAGVLYECVACSSNNYPPQRPWVGLTDEEIDEWTPEIHGVIRIVEQALKEKNFG